MENPGISLDEVLDKFSMCGRYHLQFMFLAMITFSYTVLFSHNYIFAAEESAYRCIDEAFSNNSCESVNGSRCSEWIYNNPYSFMAEFQLACQEWKRTLVGTTYSAGYMVGLLLMGPLSDRIGRLKTFILTGVMAAVVGVAKSFCFKYWLYIALEFLGALLGNSYSPFYVLNIEIVSAKKRVVFHLLCQIGIFFGGVLLPLSAWGISYWRNLVRLVHAPAILFTIYYFLMDESPRWLLIKGKKDKAIAILEKMGHKNKVKLDKDALNNLIEKDEDNKLNSVDFTNLLKMTIQSRILLKRCLVCIVWWTTCTFVYHGLMINSVSLQGNKYVNYGLTQFVHLPGSFITMYILQKYKRRNPLIWSFLAAALLCLTQSILPSGLPWLSVTVYMTSSLMATIFFNITYIYTSEMFPTYTRNSMHAMCSSIGRIGSILAPQTPLLTAYWSSLPTMIFGGASLVAGLVTFLVPDTADISLPDSVQEAEDIGKKKKQVELGIDNLGMPQE